MSFPEQSGRPLFWDGQSRLTCHIHCGQHLLWLLLVQTSCLTHSLLSASLSLFLSLFHTHTFSWQNHRVVYPSKAENLLLNLWYPKATTLRKISSTSCSVCNYSKPETPALDDISVFNMSAMERLLQVLFGINKYLAVPYHNAGVTINDYSLQYCSEIILSTKMHDHNGNILVTDQ